MASGVCLRFNILLHLPWCQHVHDTGRNFLSHRMLLLLLLSLLLRCWLLCPKPVRHFWTPALCSQAAGGVHAAQPQPDGG